MEPPHSGNMLAKTCYPIVARVTHYQWRVLNPRDTARSPQLFAKKIAENAQIRREISPNKAISFCFAPDLEADCPAPAVPLPRHRSFFGR